MSRDKDRLWGDDSLHLPIDKKATFDVQRALFTSELINHNISVKWTPFLADLQAQRADFYPVKLHLQDEYVLYRNFKKFPECFNALVLQCICHYGLQERSDQTVRM